MSRDAHRGNQFRVSARLLPDHEKGRSTATERVKDQRGSLGIRSIIEGQRNALRPSWARPAESGGKCLGAKVDGPIENQAAKQ